MRRLLDITLAGLDASQNSEDAKLAEKYAERGRLFTVGWMGKNRNKFFEKTEFLLKKSYEKM